MDRVIWIIGAVLLGLIIIVILAFSFTKILHNVKEKYNPNQEYKKIPLVGFSLLIPFKRKRKAMSWAIWLLIVVILFAILVTAISLFGKSTAHDVKHFFDKSEKTMQPNSIPNKIECSKKCATEIGEEYDECFKECMGKNEEKK